MFGWVDWKSRTTESIAAASRSVKKCHSSTVPETWVPGSAILFSLGAGVHAATSKLAVPRAKRAWGIRLFTMASQDQVGSAVADRGDEAFVHRDEPGVQRAEQHRVVGDGGDRDRALQ